MNRKKCLIALVGHHPKRLKLSIDKEIVDKILFIKEREDISGSKKQFEAIRKLNHYYKEQLIQTEIAEFSFREQALPIAELTYTICLQKLTGFDDVSVNISGGLRYMVIWFYIACLITHTDVKHGDFKYKGDVEVGINYNMNIVRIPLSEPTEKQFEFLELFFSNFDDIRKCIKNQEKFSEILQYVKGYDSIENLKNSYNERINKHRDITRGSINGYLNKLKKISAIETMVNPENKVEKVIKITYLGIAFVINHLFNNFLHKKRINT